MGRSAQTILDQMLDAPKNMDTSYNLKLDLNNRKNMDLLKAVKNYQLPNIRSIYIDHFDNQDDNLKSFFKNSFP